MYADFEYYGANWGGSVPAAQYNRMAIKASQLINYFTFNRVTESNVTENVKLCQCELCDYLYSLDVREAIQELNEDGTVKNGIIKSVTVDKLKYEYEAPTAAQKTAANKTTRSEIDSAAHSICRKWLVRPINFMYTGGILP